MSLLNFVANQVVLCLPYCGWRVFNVHWLFANRK